MPVPTGGPCNKTGNTYEAGFERFNAGSHRRSLQRRTFFCLCASMMFQCRFPPAVPATTTLSCRSTPTYRGFNAGSHRRSLQLLAVSPEVFSLMVSMPVPTGGPCNK